VIVLVDAPNVRRSLWPNLPPERLVELLARWAREHRVEAVAVFDGSAPDLQTPIELVSTGSESADDWIARRAAELEAVGEAYTLVTSDRELRRRAGEAAEQVVGGGSFARELAGSDP
jgi:rRNA-processing protein FCF1